MKTPKLLLLILYTIFIAGCNDDKTITPDPDSTFPKTYNVSPIKSMDEFRIWINDIDYTDSTLCEDVFGKPFNGYPITFLNSKDCSVQESPQDEPLILSYFFANDSLYLYGSGMDTINIGKGDRTQFTITMGYLLLVPKLSSSGSQSREFFIMGREHTKASLMVLAQEFNITQIDTLAFYNRTFLYK